MHADHAGLASTLIERTGCELLRGVGPHTIDDRLRDPGTELAERRAIGRREGVPDGRDRPVGRRAPRRRRPSHPRARAPAARAGRCPARLARRADAGAFAEPDRARRRAAPVGDHRGPGLRRRRAVRGVGLDARPVRRASRRRSIASRSSRRGCCCPATGGPVEDGPQRLAAARSAAEALATNALAALADGPRSAYDLAVAAVADPGGEQPPPVDAVDLALCARAPRAARDRDVRDRRRRRSPLHRLT